MPSLHWGLPVDPVPAAPVVPAVPVVPPLPAVPLPDVPAVPAPDVPAAPLAEVPADPLLPAGELVPHPAATSNAAPKRRTIEIDVMGRFMRSPGGLARFIDVNEIRARA